ncbi:MAG: hypothetical protein FJZ58_05500 [Chlamydiae bacterium]|nr:hypothetical protein [Chlamydiota bacterium]
MTVISYGIFGVVISERHPLKGSIAVKVPYMGDEESMEDLTREDLILQRLHEDSCAIQSNIVRRFGSQYLQGRICRLELEKHQMSLYAYLQTVGTISLPGVSWIGKEVLKALAFLKKHRLVHADVKPANILLSNPGLPGERIVLADFGHSFYERENVLFPIQPLALRSPEAVLETAITVAADMWSVACLLVNIWSRTDLFNEHHNEGYLVLLHQIRLGNLYPTRLIQRSPKYFSIWQRIQYPTSPYFSSVFFGLQARMGNRVTLEDLITKENSMEERWLRDLLREMLQFLPEQRITVAKALQHPFFSHL